MNRTFAAALALAFCLPLTARADDAAQRARAQELITILHSERMVNQLSANLLKQATDAAQQVTGADPSPESKARLDDFDKKVSGMIGAKLSWSVIEPEIVSIYAKAFTEDELTAIVGFYKSPAGTAFLAKAQDINLQLNQLAQPRIAALQTEVRQAFEDFRKSQEAAPAGQPTLNSLPPAGPSAPATPAPKSGTPSTPTGK